MELSLWLLFIVTFSSTLAIPGPNAAYAIGQTLTHGPKKGLIASAGFAFASGLNLVLVMTGLGLILSQYMDVLIYLKWMGVSYLLYMAYKVYKSNPAAPKPSGEIKNSKVFGFAVLVSLSNPKVVLFNLMLLPLFIVPDKPLLLQGIIITVTGTVLSFVVYSIYSLFASKFISRLKTKTANKVVATAYLGAAGALASLNK